jgi:hypothetical protein
LLILLVGERGFKPQTPGPERLLKSVENRMILSVFDGTACSHMAESCGFALFPGTLTATFLSTVVVVSTLV